LSASDTIFPCLSYDDAPGAIEWLCAAFGFEKRLVVPREDGGVLHSELTFGSGVILVSSTRPAEGRLSPQSLAGVPMGLSVSVEDPDAHYEVAVAAGAVILKPVEDQHFGGRGYAVRDLEGHHWFFGSYRPGEHWSSGDQGATTP
jgi:uncharacterized glyoxalase superfamily protein PhnB